MSQPTPRLSVVIPWCDRPEIEDTLRGNHRILKNSVFEVIIVNCGGDSTQLRAATTNQGYPNLKCISIRPRRFNKSLAINIGASRARANNLFLLDADILLRDDWLAEAMQQLSSGCYVTVERVFEAGAGRRPNSSLREIAYSVEFVMARGGRVSIETNRTSLSDGSRSGPGLVLLTRAHFLKVGGMNSELIGWGWEDVDLLVRLQFALGLRRHQLGSVTHLTHKSADASICAHLDGGADNFSLCAANYGLGNFRGTFAEDVKRWRELVAVENG